MDVYQIVTDKIGAMLEAGVVPWRKPWTSAGLPRNLVTKKPYRGINHFLLSASNYVSPFWLTLKQANELGGSVRKGEQSTLIVFWKIDQKTTGQTQSVTDDATEETQRRFLLRYYRVFNLEQCDLPQAALDKLPKVETHEHGPIDAAEFIIANMPQRPELETAGAKAFYSSTTDRVTMPLRELFTTAEEYYATLLHELTHYADFGIMPRFYVDRSGSRGAGERSRHNQSSSRKASNASPGR
jgi:antirestriction protein ArdC